LLDFLHCSAQGERRLGRRWLQPSSQRPSGPIPDPSHDCMRRSSTIQISKSISLLNIRDTVSHISGIDFSIFYFPFPCVLQNINYHISPPCSQREFLFLEEAASNRIPPNTNILPHLFFFYLNDGLRIIASSSSPPRRFTSFATQATCNPSRDARSRSRSFWGSCKLELNS
jgi:hypothetical protein